MENPQIARALEDVADLLEIRGENPFRIRAYRNAARTVESHTAPLRAMLEATTDLTELPGIGKEMAQHITELVNTGELKQLRDLADKVPKTLIDVMRIPGIGPKRAATLWKKLDVVNVDLLEQAAQAGKIARVEGFGVKTQTKILEGIAAHRQHTARMKLVDADQLVEPLLKYMKKAPGIEQLDVAGSYRRRRETIGDLDILAVAKKPGPVMKWFTAYPAVAEVLATGDTRGTVVLRSGLQVDLRIVPPRSYGAAMIYFTGSKPHNVKLRTMALAKGLSISEYGVFRLEEGKPRGEGRFVAGKTEKDVYAAVDLPWIEPEIREDRGELEAAARDKLPRLLQPGDIRGDLQMHSTWSDGKESIETMLSACEELGHEYIAMTDHSAALAMTRGLTAERAREQWTEIEDVQARHPKIRLLRSMEVDILADGSLDLDDQTLEQLDVVVVSIHSRFDLPAAQQTGRILKALRHPEVDILAHPTGRRINRREPIQFAVSEVLACAAEMGVTVECNAQPHRLDLKDTHLMEAKRLGVKVVISTDSHRIQELSYMRYGVEQARRAWLEKKDVINTLPLAGFLKALRRKS